MLLYGALEHTDPAARVQSRSKAADASDRICILARERNQYGSRRAQMRCTWDGDLGRQMDKFRRWSIVHYIPTCRLSVQWRDSDGPNSAAAKGFLPTRRAVVEDSSSLALGSANHYLDLSCATRRFVNDRRRARLYSARRLAYMAAASEYSWHV